MKSIIFILFLLSFFNQEEVDKIFHEGVIKLTTKDYKGAIENFTKVLEQNPNYYRAFEMRSLSKSNLGDFKAAISDMDTLIARYPDESGHYETRAYYKRNSGDFTGAIEDYTKAIELYKNASYFINRGNLYIDIEEYTKALEDYESAIELDAESGEAYCFTGLAYLKMNEMELACENLKKAAELGNKSAYKTLKEHCRCFDN
ncbi:MAG TPA: tetratricopeptide repeat protein, partial [Candidatus Kapabacteria bacterium]|nr:tetratricopeptide repeat protein [Candidatus Kapabacteria bacterium]